MGEQSDEVEHRTGSASSNEVTSTARMYPDTHDEGRYSGLRIVVVGKDTATREPLIRILGVGSMQVLEAVADERALALIAGCEPDVVLIDRTSPSNDLQFAEKLIADTGIGDRVIMLSDLGDRRDHRAAMLVGITRRLIKPVSPPQLIRAVLQVQRTAHSTYPDPDQAPPTERTDVSPALSDPASLVEG